MKKKKKKEKESRSKFKIWVEDNKIIGDDMYFNKTFVTLKEISSVQWLSRVRLFGLQGSQTSQS